MIENNSKTQLITYMLNLCYIHTMKYYRDTKNEAVLMYKYETKGIPLWLCGL